MQLASTQQYNVNIAIKSFSAQLVWSVCSRLKKKKLVGFASSFGVTNFTVKKCLVDVTSNVLIKYKISNGAKDLSKSKYAAL